MSTKKLNFKLNEFQIWNIYCKEFTNSKRDFAETYLNVLNIVSHKINNRKDQYSIKFVIEENKKLNNHLIGCDFPSDKIMVGKKNQKLNTQRPKEPDPDATNKAKLKNRIATTQREMQEVWADSRNMDRWRELDKQIQEAKALLKDVEAGKIKHYI